MAKTRAPHNPLAAILRAGREPVTVTVQAPNGEEANLVLRQPPAKVRAQLLETIADSDDEKVGTMLALCEGAVKASLDAGGSLSDDDVSDLVATSGGIQGELAMTALRLCGMGRPVGKQSPFPSGSQDRSVVRSRK